MAASHQDLANAIRFLSAEMVEKANSGHPGLPLGAADIATVLFSQFLKFDASDPRWPDRDRFVLSAGHGSALLYSLLYLTGYQDATKEDMMSFRQIGAKMAGHPEYGHLAGIENTSGPLGQGLGMAVGMAAAERMLAARFGKELVNHYTYVLCGDGCLMEGVSEEAISLAGHLKLGRLIVLWDDNRITIDGATDLATSTDQAARFKANGWNTLAADGHNPEAVAAAIAEARKSDRPTMIACRTTIGYGCGPKAGTPKVHGSPLGPDGIKALRETFGWTLPPFEVPESTLSLWRTIGSRGREERLAWEKRAQGNAEFERTAVKKELPEDWLAPLQALKEKEIAEKTGVASRKSSQMALEALIPAVPELVGGSADLTGSNLTKVAGMTDVSAKDFKGNYVNYGIREHEMGAFMNGMALHGGLIPYGGAFFVFSDYVRPAIRLAALMKLRTIYVFTHDSIGVGEDGPTHQPIEHLASFRAMPNVLVLRPCDAIETAECWEIAIRHKSGPTLLILSRQNLPLLRRTINENKSMLGAHVLYPYDTVRDVTLMASGSEVALARKAQEILAKEKITAAVVSVPSFELFEAQSADYRAHVLGKAPRIAIEAASGFGWERYTLNPDNVIALKDFGASGPAEKLYAHLGLTVEAIVEKARKALSPAKG